MESYQALNHFAAERAASIRERNALRAELATLTTQIKVQRYCLDATLEALDPAYAELENLIRAVLDGPHDQAIQVVLATYLKEIAKKSSAHTRKSDLPPNTTEDSAQDSATGTKRARMAAGPSVQN